MRTLTAAQKTTLQGAHLRVSLRVWVEDSAGLFTTNLSALDGRDWVDEVEWDEDIDQPVSQLTVRLWREVYAKSLAPLMAGSTLNKTGTTYTPVLEAGREIKVDVATTPVGVEPVAADWKTVFHGEIDEVDWGGSAPRLSLTARDLGARLMDRFIEEERTYGAAAGMAVEAVMQKILDDNIAGTTLDPRVLLVTPASPGWMIKEFKQEKEPLLEALRKLAAQIGWDVRYRWDEASAAFRLTFFDPGRARAATAPAEDWTFGPSHYLDVSALRSSRTAVRNAVRVVYTDSADGKRKTVLAKDDASVSRYGRRFMELEEGASSLVDTAAEAQQLADSVLNDLRDPKAEQEIELHFFWPGEVGDLYTFVANHVHYDANQRWAVVGVRHQLTREQQRTRIRVRGSVAGSYRDWLRREVRVTGAAQHDPGIAILSPRVLASVGGDFADLLVGVQSEAGEHIRLYLRDGDTGAVWALVAGPADATPRFAPPGTELGVNDWFHDGAAFAQKLRALPLLRDQVRRVSIQGQAQNSGAFSTWIPVTLEAKAQPWLESVDLTFDEVSDLVTLAATGGAFCESVRGELSEAADFSTVFYTVDTSLADGERKSVSVSAAARRNRTVYARVTPYNGPVVTGVVTGLAGQPQQDSEFVPAGEGGIRPPSAEIRQSVATPPTAAAETLTLSGSLGAGGAPFDAPAAAVRWRTRVDHARTGRGTAGVWSTTALPAELPVTRDARWDKTVVLEVEDRAGRLGTASYTVVSRLEGLDESGLVDMDLPQKGGQRIESQTGAEIRVLSAYGGELHKNPAFARWTGTFPDGWSSYMGTPGKETTLVRSGGNAVRFVSATATEAKGMRLQDTAAAGVVQGLGSPEFLVVELDVLFASGGAQGAGVLVDWTNTAGTAFRNVNDFHLAPELGPAPLQNVWHTVRKVVRRPAAFTGTFRGMGLYLMGNYPSFAGGGSAKDVVVDRLVLREATPQEVSAFLGLNDAGRLVSGLENGADVGGLPARVVARQGQGIFLEEFKEIPTDWGSPGATVTPTLAAGAGVTGSNVLRVSRGYWGAYFPNDLPFDPSKLYRLRARARQVDDPGYSDSFTTDTLAAGSWDAGGDAPATWTVATTPGMLTGDGGTQATLIRKTLSAADALVRVEAVEAHDGGIIARYQDNGNYYLLTVRDDSGSSPNLMLFKRVAGVFTQLATADVAWTRGAGAVIELEVVGSSLRALFNGTQVIGPVTDTSIPGPGRFGLRNNAPAGGLFKVDRFDVTLFGVAAAMVGNKYFYFGVRAINAAGGVIANYYIAANVAQPATGTTWTEYTGWLRGNGPVRLGASDPTSPSGLPATTRYIRPVVLVNWQGVAANGTQEVDYLSIDVLDEDAAERTYKAIGGGGANIKEIPWIRAGLHEAPTALFKRGSDGAADVREDTLRSFVSPDYLDTSRRPGALFRGGAREIAENLFRRGTDTLDDVRDSGQFQRATPGDISDARVGRGSAGTSPRNLLQNGGGQSATVAPWTVLPGYAGSGGLAVDTAVFRYGDRSLRLWNTTSVEAAYYQDVAVADGDILELRGWLKSGALPTAEAGQGLILNVDPVNGSLTGLDRSAPYYPTVHDPHGVDVGLPADGVARDWTYVRTRFRSVGCTVVRVHLFLGYGGGQSGTGWFDGLELERLSGYEAETARRTARAASSAGLLVNPGFEVPDPLEPGRPFGWRRTEGGAAESNIRRGVVDGRSVMVLGNSGAEIGVASSMVKVTPGRRYRARATLRGSGAAASGLYLYLFYTTTNVPGPQHTHVTGTAGLGHGVAQNGSQYPAHTSNVAWPAGWTTYEFTWVAPAGAQYASFNVAKWTGANAIEGYVDEFVVEDVETAAGAAEEQAAAGMLTKNSTFSRWPESDGYPEGFSWWQGPVPTRERAITRVGGQALRYAIGGGNAGVALFHLGEGQIPPNFAFVVVEVDLYLVSGSIAGSGVHINTYDTAHNAVGGSGPGRMNLHFADPAVLGSGPTAGRWHTVRQVLRVDATNGNAYCLYAYLMTNWEGFGGGTPAKDIVFDRFVVRPATAQEVAAHRGLDTATGYAVAGVHNNATVNGGPANNLFRRGDSAGHVAEVAGHGGLGFVDPGYTDGRRPAAVFRNGGFEAVVNLFRRGESATGVGEVGGHGGLGFVDPGYTDGRRPAAMLRNGSFESAANLFRRGESATGVGEVGGHGGLGFVDPGYTDARRPAAMLRNGGFESAANLIRHGDDVSRISNAESVRGAEVRVASAAAGQFFRNPSFARWPDGNTFPNGYGGWAGSPIRETGIVRNSPYAVRFQLGANGWEAGLRLSSESAEHVPVADPAFVVLEADVLLVSGSMDGAGFLVDWRVADGAGGEWRQHVDFAAEVGSNPPLGRWLTIRKVVERPGGAPADATVGGYLMCAWNGLRATTAKDIVFGRLALREASQQEVASFRGLDLRGNIRDQRRLRQITVTNKGSSPTTPTYLRAYDNGYSARIEVDTFTVQYAWGSSTYYGTTLYGLLFNTTYHLFCEDPDFLAGSVTYGYTPYFSDVTNAYGRVYIGSIRTPYDGSTGGTSGGGGGGCVAADSYLAPGLRAGDARPGDRVTHWVEGSDHEVEEVAVQGVRPKRGIPSFRLTSASGVTLVVGLGTPLTLRDGTELLVQHADGVELLVDDRGALRWERVRVEPVGPRDVVLLSIGGGVYAAGEEPDRRIFTHNLVAVKQEAM